MDSNEKDKLRQAIRDINIAIATLKTQIIQEHICRYDGTMGSLLEFKSNTEMVRSDIYSKLKKLDKQVEDLEDKLTIMEVSIANAEANRSELKKWLMGIASSIILFFVLWLYKTVLLGI